MMNTRPFCRCVAYMLLTVHMLADSNSISRSGPLTSCRATPVANDSAMTGAGC